MLKTFAALALIALVSPHSEANERNLYRDDRVRSLNVMKNQQRLLQADSSKILLEESVRNEVFCSLKCVKNSECQSANLQRTDDGGLQCQLLKTDRYKEEVAKWKTDPKSVHISIKVKGTSYTFFYTFLFHCCFLLQGAAYEKP